MIVDDEAFREGDSYMTQIERDGKWGYVDTTGREVIAPKYDYVDFFEDGRAEVELDGQAFYIDKSGNRVE